MANAFPTIYKRDSKGNIREWRMELDLSDGVRYRTVAGLQDGQQVTSAWTVVHGKNVGRSNETSPEAQAIAEINSHYKKKLDVDYHARVEDIDTPKIFKPMLAKKWEDRKAKIDWEEGVWIQPKLDGIRCIISERGAFTRTGKPITSIPHILEALQPLFDEHPDLILDGELYNHVLKHDFNKITSVVKRQKNSPSDLARSAELVQYHIYDMPSEMTEPYVIRHSLITELIQIAYANVSCIQVVETELCWNEEEVDEAYGRFVGQGYEGGIIRLNAPYEQKRSNNLLKRKDFEDDEFEIVGFIEGTGNWAGCAKVVVFTIPGVTDGLPFEDLPRATVQGSRAYGEHVLANQANYIGKQATIQYFNLTPDGIPRFPIAKILHEDERW
jgi:DNA ligase-1